MVKYLSLAHKQARDFLDYDRDMNQARFTLNRKAVRLNDESYRQPTKMEQRVGMKITIYFNEMIKAIDNANSSDDPRSMTGVVDAYVALVQKLREYKAQSSFDQRDISELEHRFDALLQPLSMLLIHAENLGWRRTEDIEHMHELISDRVYIPMQDDPDIVGRDAMPNLNRRAQFSFTDRAKPATASQLNAALALNRPASAEDIMAAVATLKPATAADINAALARIQPATAADMMAAVATLKPATAADLNAALARIQPVTAAELNAALANNRPDIAAEFDEAFARIQPELAADMVYAVGRLAPELAMDLDAALARIQPAIATQILNAMERVQADAAQPATVADIQALLLAIVPGAVPAGAPDVVPIVPVDALPGVAPDIIPVIPAVVAEATTPGFLQRLATFLFPDGPFAWTEASPVPSEYGTPTGTPTASPLPSPPSSPRLPRANANLPYFSDDTPPPLNFGFPNLQRSPSPQPRSVNSGSPNLREATPANSGSPNLRAANSRSASLRAASLADTPPPAENLGDPNLRSTPPIDLEDINVDLDRRSDVQDFRGLTPTPPPAEPVPAKKARKARAKDPRTTKEDMWKTLQEMREEQGFPKKNRHPTYDIFMKEFDAVQREDALRELDSSNSKGVVFGRGQTGGFDFMSMLGNMAKQTIDSKIKKMYGGYSAAEGEKGMRQGQSEGFIRGLSSKKTSYNAADGLTRVERRHKELDWKGFKQMLKDRKKTMKRGDEPSYDDRTRFLFQHEVDESPEGELTSAATPAKVKSLIMKDLKK